MNKPGIKQVEVQIMSQTYMLACPVDGEPALREAVAKVDSAMCRIRDAGKVKARERIAVLAALNLAYQLADRPQALPTAPRGDEAAAPVDIDALVRRIDAALGQDGQLL